MMMLKEKRDIIPLKPVIGFAAVAISLGGILYYTLVRIRRNKTLQSKPSHPSNKGNAKLGNSRQENAALLLDLPLAKVSSPTCSSSRSSSGRYSVDRDDLPEFKDIVAFTTDDTSPVARVESTKYRCAEHNEYDREIKNLLEKVETLQERERNLEIELLEYYGVKEQETAVMELKNRLRLNSMEAKLYTLKIDALQADNRRLEAQVAEYAKAVVELENARAKIKVLRKKLRAESEHHRDQILNLQAKVEKLQDQEKAEENEIYVDVLRRERKELEEELEEMKKYNHALELEKSELAHKMEYLQMIATSALDNDEVQELRRESGRLKSENENLNKELEQLKADRCKDTEELVYLRWINACLRYELRNYRPDPGKTLARDLNKTISPKSGDRAKKLVVEYASKEGSRDKGRNNITDFDSDHCSSSQSNFADSPDDSSVSNVGSHKEKSNHLSRQKVFAKLKRLLKGKDHHRSTEGSRPPLERTSSVDEFDSASVSCKSAITDDGCRKTSRNSSSSSRLSLDLPRSVSRGQKSSAGGSNACSGRNSVDGAMGMFRRIDSITEDENDTDFKPTPDAQNLTGNDLVKYAEALKNSRMRSSFRRSSSFSSL